MGAKVQFGQFRRLIAESGKAVIRLPPRTPDLNAYAERFARSIKEECLNRMIFVGQVSLPRAITEFKASDRTDVGGAQSERNLVREPDCANSFKNTSSIRTHGS